MSLHLPRYQGFAVVYYSFTLDALNLEHHRQSYSGESQAKICGYVIPQI